MNKITKALTALKCLQMAKAQEEVRGKEFTKVYTAFVNLFAGLFVGQTQFFLDYIASHEHIFTPDGGLIIEKSDEFGDMIPDDGFIGELESFLIKAHMIGQDQTNKEVVGQADISLEVKNLGASLYAKNRAGELMKGVNDTTKDEVRTLFSKAWEENWSVSDISSAIEEKFTQFSKYRASLIATMEVANAYEIGKKDQFALYQNYYHFDGFKRSQTQHDSGVRYKHALNEVEGWIPEKQLFSGTDTDHAPHGFNCRCVTLRSLLPPEVDDVVGVQFDKDSSSYIDQSQKLEISNAVQNFRTQAPYLPKISALSDFGDAGDGVIARYWGKKDILAVNSIEWDNIEVSPEWGVAGSYSGIARKNAIVYHELGHYLESYIEKQATDGGAFRDIPWVDVHDSMIQAKISLLSKWQSGEIPSMKYPLDTVSSKGYEQALKELFAESVSGYTMGKIDILDEDMKKFLDFIFLK